MGACCGAAGGVAVEHEAGERLILFDASSVQRGEAIDVFEGAGILGDMGGEDFVRSELGAGRWRLLVVCAGGETLAYVVAGIECEGPEDRYLMVYGAASVRPDVSMSSVVLNMLHGLAGAMGCDGLRFSTRRRGLVKAAERAGCEVRHVVTMRS